MSSLSICPLLTRPELTAESARLVGSLWPGCEADRLPRLVASECSGQLPCSLILLQHEESTPDTVIGFARLVQVTRPKTPPTAYLESVCIEKSRQGAGLGKKMILMVEEYAAEVLGCQQIVLICKQSMAGYYARLCYEVIPPLSYETVGANLVLHPEIEPGKWFVNTEPSGWEAAYDGRPTASKQDVGLSLMSKDVIAYAMRKTLLKGPKQCPQ